MYAIVAIGTTQHRVSAGETLKIDLRSGQKAGDSLVFDKIMMLGGENYQIGTPFVAGASVKATVTSMGLDGEGVKGDKIRVFKKKRRKGFHKTIGHRQRYTEIKIDSIEG